MGASPLLILGIMALAAAVTLMAGAAEAFVFVWIPSAMLLFRVPLIDIDYLPDPTTTIGCMYGILLGLVLKAGEVPRFRWNVVDTIVVLLSVAHVISAVTTEVIYTGVSVGGQEVLAWMMPYFLARHAFCSAQLRRSALWIVVGCFIVIGVFGVIETRLWPHFFTNTLWKILQVPDLVQSAFKRGGFFRSHVSFSHPIYLGDAAVAAAGMIAALAGTSGVSLRNPWVRAGLAATGVGLIVCLSFGPVTAAAAAVLTYVAMSRLSLARLLVVPMVVGGIVMLYAFTVAIVPTDVKIDDNAPEYVRSYEVRKLIVKNSWNLVSTAGLWGHGANIPKDELNLDSVDNAYLVFAMTRGWVYLGLFLLMIVWVAHRVKQAMARCRSNGERMPLAAAFASFIGVLVGMYTVWAAEDFINVWLPLTALLVTLTELALTRPRADPRQVAAAAAFARRLSAEIEAVEAGPVAAGTADA